MANASLEGKIAVVTGGSRGLGRAMVNAFADAGASVVIASRKLEACETLAAEVEARTGRTALAVQTNVSRWRDCDALVEAAYETFDRVDVLVNNAGMSPLYPSVDELARTSTVGGRRGPASATRPLGNAFDLHAESPDSCRPLTG